ncbi:MAG: di-trans,poly-cis-decaprenylcistransferase [Alphaproteobacteria bacterium]|nr:di-trans,poly-cis-decaprenylcistransferase [Alphaproteobacteria bacterium]
MSALEHSGPDDGPKLSPDGPVPRHIGVIMDGNGRWAAAQGRPRNEGHRAGLDALGRLVEICNDRGVQYLTIYSFSSENWRRPQREISFLFGLLQRFVTTELDGLVEKNIRARVIGERASLSAPLRSHVAKIEEKTAGCTGLNLMIAFNYGGRQELVNAVRTVCDDVASGTLKKDDIDAEAISARLYAADVPDPDLIVRSGGEQRLSNFLLWQAAYTELVYIDDLWPDFNAEMFDRILREYARRERRFGGLGSGAAIHE